MGVPGGRVRPAAETFAGVSMLSAALTLVAGPALAATQFGRANPVAAEVMPSSGGSLAGGLISVVTVSSVMPVVTLFVPLLLIGVAIYSLTDTAAIRPQARTPRSQGPAAAAPNLAPARCPAARVAQ